MNFKKELNEKQFEIASKKDGTFLVLAGAGSGKTRTIIYRTAYLIQKYRIKPWNILVVTFTNKAASELKERLERKFAIPAKSLWVGTFHSICGKILRREEKFLPFSSNFSIYDAKDQKKVLKDIYKKFNIDNKQFNMGAVHHIISSKKSNLILPENFFDYEDETVYTKTVYKIYNEYQKILLQNNALDFDDMLVQTVKLLEKNELVRKKYENLFKYVMIDEYQDTNRVQFKIINLIAKKRQNLCVVGDDDQAIYSWRGADIRNILNFEKDYNNVEIVKLEQNYRSSKNILNLANSLISKNSNRHKKELWSDIDIDEMPKLETTNDEIDETKYVMEEIENLREKNNARYSDFAILYRTNAQSRVFETSFMRKRIPYQIIGGVNFFQRKEIKDIVAYLRALTNPSDENSLLRILNFPKRGIGKVSTNKILDLSIEKNITITELILKNEYSELKGALARKLNKFSKLMNKWLEVIDNSSAEDLVKDILEDLDLVKHYKASNDPKIYSKGENLLEFLTSVKEFCDNFKKSFDKEATIIDFLQNVSLHSDLDTYEEKKNENRVKIMTMHNAKGLEFPYVFVVGLEDGLLPHERSMESENDIEEERRLLYVACTRAKKDLFLTYATWRTIYGQRHPKMASRFLEDFNRDFLKSDEEVVYKCNEPKIYKKKRKKVVLESEKLFSIGDVIEHKKFGRGKILNVGGKGKNAKLTISFTTGQLKKILGSFVEKI